MIPRPPFKHWQSYQIKAQLSHRDMLDFLRQEMRHPGLFKWIFWLANMLILGGMIYRFWNNALPWHEELSYAGLGFLLFLILIPLHEYIHVLGYKAAGAKNVSVHAEWKKGIFYALADHFVAERRPFTRLAIAPFLFINTLLLLLIPFSGPAFEAGLWSALLIHTGGCYGDFALMNWMWRHRKSEPVTWDDAESGTSYFACKY